MQFSLKARSHVNFDKHSGVTSTAVKTQPISIATKTSQASPLESNLPHPPGTAETGRLSRQLGTLRRSCK